VSWCELADIGRRPVVVHSRRRHPALSARTRCTLHDDRPGHPQRGRAGTRAWPHALRSAV